MRKSEARKSTPSPNVVLSDLGIELHTAFQPIVSAVHSKIVGHEALVRGQSPSAAQLSPIELFPQLYASMSAQQINETCARLHLESFAAQQGAGWVFINVSPDAMPDRAGVISQFGSWLKESGLSPHQVVVEIIETRAYNEALLAEAVAGLRDLGCLVAIDDFGAGESNFERVWRLRPDIVKLDRAMICEAARDPLVQRVLPGIVSLMHEAGCLVVMEGIENQHQALIALESDVDFVQGFYFSHPTRTYDESTNLRPLFDQLADSLRSTQAERSAMDRGFFANFSAGLEACVSALEDDIGFHDACAVLLAVAGVQRVYELDQDGYQIDDNAESPNHAHADPRFLPCASARGANWHRRSYFRRAIAHPGEVQISKPYLSIRDASSCVTMSLAFEYKENLRVLCVDLDYDQSESLFPSDDRQSGVVQR